MIAAISSVVATGRRMKMREGLISRNCRNLHAPVAGAPGPRSPSLYTLRERVLSAMRRVRVPPGDQPGWLTGCSVAARAPAPPDLAAEPGADPRVRPPPAHPAAA